MKRQKDRKMALDKIALIVVCIGAGIWFLTALAITSAASISGLGIPALIFLVAGGWFMWRIIQDRMSNEEDNYYEKNVER